MIYFDFNISDSKFQEKKFIDSFKNNLYHFGVSTQNSVSQTGVVRNRTIGEGVQDQSILSSFDNPFYIKFPFSKFNVLGNFVGEIKVENTKSAQKSIDNETLTLFSYVLKTSLGFQTKKLIPIIIAILGLLFSFGDNFFGTVLTFAIIIVLWYIIIKIIGNINLKKGQAKLTNIIENYQDIV